MHVNVCEYNTEYYPNPLVTLVHRMGWVDPICQGVSSVDV